MQPPVGLPRGGSVTLPCMTPALVHGSWQHCDEESGRLLAPVLLLSSQCCIASGEAWWDDLTVFYSQTAVSHHDKAACCSMLPIIKHLS